MLKEITIIPCVCLCDYERCFRRPQYMHIPYTPEYSSTKKDWQREITIQLKWEPVHLQAMCRVRGAWYIWCLSDVCWGLVRCFATYKYSCTIYHMITHLYEHDGAGTRLVYGNGMVWGCRHQIWAHIRNYDIYYLTFDRCACVSVALFNLKPHFVHCMYS